MKMHRQTALLAVALLASSTAAHASQSFIKVWTDVDTSLALMRADGSPLPDAVELHYVPKAGLQTWMDPVRIYSNDTAKGVAVRLGTPAVLTA